MTWLDRFARTWGLAPTPAQTARPSKFRPALEQLARRDVPALIGTASLSGYVYVDCNNDGTFGPGESPIAGATVTLTRSSDGFLVTQTTTDSKGYYAFTGLPADTYTITETQPGGYLDGKDTQGTPGTGTTGNDVFSNIVLADGVKGVSNNFGELCPTPPPPPKTGSLSGVVYFDCNKNGVRDAGETGIAGVKVTLSGPGGTRTMTTDSLGRYAFTDLISGSYTVTETQPTGYGQGKNLAGTPLNGIVTGDVISGISVNGTALTNYNFGETKVYGCDTGCHPIVCDNGGKDRDCDKDNHDRDCDRYDRDRDRGDKYDKDCDNKGGYGKDCGDKGGYVVCGTGGKGGYGGYGDCDKGGKDYNNCGSGGKSFGCW